MDNNEEEEALRIEDESVTNREGRYKQHTESKVSDVMPTQGVISGGKRGSEVLGQVENSQRRLTALDIASDTASPKSLRNQEGSYTPLDILLIPGTNTPTNSSGIHNKFPEDSTNATRVTQIPAAKIKV
jgi:exosome complex RNA-binding protein Csl4